MKLIKYISLIIACLYLVSCGGSGSKSSEVTSGSSIVKITIGQRDSGKYVSSSQPSTTPLISCVLIRVSASDMATVEREVCGVSGERVQVVLEIPIGLNRHFEIIARGASGADECYGNTYADLGEGPAEVMIYMVCEDREAPVFEGIKTAVALTANTVQLGWMSATDNQTPANAMIYSIYRDN